MIISVPFPWFALLLSSGDGAMSLSLDALMKPDRFGDRHPPKKKERNGIKKAKTKTKTKKNREE